MLVSDVSRATVAVRIAGSADIVDYGLGCFVDFSKVV